MKVFLDAAHGGRKAGAKHGSLLAKEINLRCIESLSAILRKRGHDTFLPRYSDTYVRRTARKNLMHEADIGITIDHHGGATWKPCRNCLEPVSDMELTVDSLCPPLVLYKDGQEEGETLARDLVFALSNGAQKGRTEAMRTTGLFNWGRAWEHAYWPTYVSLSPTHVSNPMLRKLVDEGSWFTFVAETIAALPQFK